MYIQYESIFKFELSFEFISLLKHSLFYHSRIENLTHETNDLSLLKIISASVKKSV